MSSDQSLNTSPGSPSGRRRSPQAHEAILDAALAMLEEVGYHRLTIEGVATRAGVGKATIYRWWSTKANLVIEAINCRLEQPPPLTGNPSNDIRAMILRIVDAFAGPLGYVLPALAADLADDPKATNQLAGVLGPYRASNVAVLLSVVGQGDVPHDIDTTTVLDAIAGTILFRRLMHRPLDGVLAEQLAALVLTGQLPRIQAPRTG